MMNKSPKLSVIVIAYDMGREIPRTLQSLSADYQLNVTADDYEVIVVDNGSPTPLSEAMVTAHGPNFRYHYIDDARPSPVIAVNTGVAISSGSIVGIIIDGARVVTPGVIHYALLAFKMYDDPVVGLLGWHLGPEPQQTSVSKGYNQEVEDGLLKQIAWPEDGYRLYEIGSLVRSSAKGWFEPATESNALFLRRDSFDELGGYDTAFDKPGGELCNPDFYCRACERDGATLVNLLGEGTFHQVHGGISTNNVHWKAKVQYRYWAMRYKKLRGKPIACPEKKPVFIGIFPPQALPHLAESLKVD